MIHDHDSDGAKRQCSEVDLAGKARKEHQRQRNNREGEGKRERIDAGLGHDDLEAEHHDHHREPSNPCRTY